MWILKWFLSRHQPLPLVTCTMSYNRPPFRHSPWIRNPVDNSCATGHRPHFAPSTKLLYCYYYTVTAPYNIYIIQKTTQYNMGNIEMVVNRNSKLWRQSLLFVISQHKRGKFKLYMLIINIIYKIIAPQIDSRTDWQSKPKLRLKNNGIRLPISYDDSRLN